MEDGQPNRIAETESPGRLRLAARGAVQGVGFRPFVHRLATELNLKGWVMNSAAGLVIEVEGRRAALDLFLHRFGLEKPPHSLLQGMDHRWMEPVGYAGFEIRESSRAEPKTTLVLPDLATCPDCLREILDPADRRHRYPFTNCTHCGPRFTIVEGLPYDRAQTSMKEFKMCPACRREYEDPLDRRFHAQPNACPVCGPQLTLWDGQGAAICAGHLALEKTAAALREGQIAAVKGLGGFHLMVAAHIDHAVDRLRRLKHREEKPFALMFPSLAQVRRECLVTELEEQLLSSSQAPIVLLSRRSATGHRPSAISQAVAPGNPCLGVMLAYTPLHHLLMDLVQFPVVATSGNLAEEPICTDEHEALARLGSMAGLFLVHNRPIVRHADDSIVRVIAGRPAVLRRARGYAPLPVRDGSAEPGPIVLAVGAHLKNSVALAIGPQTFISQHIGDLETVQASAAFEQVIADFQNFYEVQPEVIAADAHPDYLSTKYADRSGLPVVHVQHHYAHILSCMAEHGLEEDVLGVSWDGTGLGTDGTIWGGEFLTVTRAGFERFGHLRTFRLPGGDKAVREPRRSALGLLYAAFGEAAFEMTELAAVRSFSDVELNTVKKMLVQKLNAPVTSSAGRLFDAVAALLGLRQRVAFEGQAAMELEFAALSPSDAVASVRSEPSVRLGPSVQPMILDWEPILGELISRKDLPVSVLSRRFHDSLVEGIVRVAEQAGKEPVVLSGGCFQNRYLTERAVERLRRAGFRPYWHELVPPNDGGIALGQVMAARRWRAGER